MYDATTNNGLTESIVDEHRDGRTARFLPNLFLLGAAKCGTTTLHAYLRDMPDICMSEPKEPFFFEREWPEGLEFYRKTYFAHWQGESILGEARHRNLYLPYVPERIHATNPEAKLIVAVRNPITRAFSHWYHKRTHNVEPLSFRKAIEADWKRIQSGLLGHSPEEIEQHIHYTTEHPQRPDGPYRTYIDSGYYHEQIQRYLALFPREQLKVVLFDHLVADPAPVVDDVVAFLEIDGRKNHFTARIHENRSRLPDPPGWLGTFYHRSGLRAMMPSHWRGPVREFVFQKVGKLRKPGIDNRTRRWLHDHYREHNRRLAEFLDRDLSHWT